MGAPLNDVSLAAFGTAALAAWSRFHRRPTIGAAALTGILAGLAMGVKYPALVLTGLIAVMIAGELLRRACTARRLLPGMVGGVHPTRPTSLKSGVSGCHGLSSTRAAMAPAVTGSVFGTRGTPGPSPWPGSCTTKRIAPLAVFVMIALATGGLWYARAFAHTGNPVYPFFRQTFGGAGLDEVLGPEKRPMAVDPWHVLTALGPMTLKPDRFDSLSHQFGPVFLLFLPALILERPPRRVLGLVAIGYAFLTVCLTQRQSMRFVLTAVGPMSVGVAWLADRWCVRRSVPARALVAMVVAVLACQSALAAARARHGLRVVLGIERADQYLERREPTFRVGRWVGAHLPKSARLVGQDHRGFYFPRDYTMELAHRRRTGLGRRGESAGEIVGRLKQAGFTHVLLCPPVPETAVEFDPTLCRRLAPWLADRAPVYREDLTDGDGVSRRYAIYALADDWLAAIGGPSR
jgi:hypothetical protein